MHRRIMSSGLLFFVLCLSGGAVMAQGISIGEIEFDSFEWGSRNFYIPVDNVVNDTAYVNIIIHTIYPQHYLSGLERLEVDTTIAIAPRDVEDLVIPATIHGSFERIVTRVMVFWRYNNFELDPTIPDSTFQIFNNVFRAKGDATKFAGRKHSLGPVHSVMDHFLMNFEYPRLILFLLARGESVDNINTLFEANIDYTNQVIADLQEDGFFPFPDDGLAPGIMTIAEYEGYVLKPFVDKAVEAFSDWYQKSGKENLGKILSGAGIDQYTGELPSLQMALLLTLLKENWLDPEHGVDVPRFEDKDVDLQIFNRPLWMAQGGEFFLPKLCLAAFDEQGQLHLGTFSPNPKLPFDKATIYDLRKEVEESDGSVITVEAPLIRLALEDARKQGLVGKMAASLESILDDEETKKIFEYYRPYHKPLLADYLCRLSVGAYFVDNKPGERLDCFKVRF